MRKIFHTNIIIIALLTIVLRAGAQESVGAERTALPNTPMTATEDALDVSDTLYGVQRDSRAEDAYGTFEDDELAYDGLYDLSSLAYECYGPFGLHEGLNVSMGLSVMGSFGKHARSGVGFGQHLAATYIKPLGKHWWLTAGGYIDHIFWGGDSYTSGGLYGEVGYQFNPHWAAYIYGQKNLVNTNNGIGYRYGRFGLYSAGSPFDYYNMSDKLGAGVRWTPNHNFSVEVSVEKDWYPHSTFGNYSHQYDYPLPK